MIRTMSPTAALLVMVALSVPGCASSTYDSRYQYTPHPASVELRQRDTDRTLGRTLVSVTGLLREISDDDDRPAVEVRLRIENVTDESLQLDADSLRLLSADLREFERPLIIGETPQPEWFVPLHGARAWTLVFPFPQSPMQPFDLSALTLKWALLREDSASAQEQTFSIRPRVRYERYRVYDPWYDPWHGPSVHWHFGVHHYSH